MINMFQIIRFLAFFLFLIRVHGSTLASVSDLYVIGVDAGTESLRAGLFRVESKGRSTLVSTANAAYKTSYPKPGWAEQSPDDWWSCMGDATRRAIEQSGVDPKLVRGLCVDSTACSVVALGQDFKHLRPCLLWCDGRSADQCKEILEKGRGDPALKRNCNGAGPLSAEWMIPKALWIKQNEPHIWSSSTYICEKQDYFNYKLTGKLVMSGCNVAARWHCNGDGDFKAENINGKRPVMPESLLKSIGMSDLIDKWPSSCISMGSKVGDLTSEAAQHLGLHTGVSVIQGGPDAYVGMIGLGCVRPNSLSIITGSSHLHLAVSGSFATAEGLWGTYKDAPLPGLYFSEGGQSSTGSALQWFKRVLGIGAGSGGVSGSVGGSGSGSGGGGGDVDTPSLSFQTLDKEAEESPIGSNGVICLETFQGARTPVTDPLARGGFLGLSLATSRGDMWRAMMEGICMGTKNAIDSMKKAGLGGDVLNLGGGAARSEVFLQMHADVTGLPIVVGEFDNAPLLGSAILAAVGSGLFDDKNNNDNNNDNSNDNNDCDNDDASVKRSKDLLGKDVNDKHVVESEGVKQALALRAKVERAVESFVRVSRRVEPRPHATKEYERIFSIYKNVAASIADISHALASGSWWQDGKKMPSLQSATSPSSSSSSPPPSTSIPTSASSSKSDVILCASLLSADFGALAKEASLLQEIGATHIHIDICDNSMECLGSLTVGPATVKSIRRSVPGIFIDVHLVSANPEVLIPQLADAGCDRVIFQFEVDGDGSGSGGSGGSHTSNVNMKDTSQAATERIIRLANIAKSHGMLCGVCIKPPTPISVLDDLLAIESPSPSPSPLIDMVDLLAVNPGFAGQTMQPSVIQKSVDLRKKWPRLRHFAIDGGVNVDTSAQLKKSGANMFIAGSAIFGPQRRLEDGKDSLESNFHTLLRALI